ncbi:MAG TPA: ATP-binding protein [Vicinamibacterales bacterium]|nr:ATP-binding protein [Vicinamibacterales bacterium]
MDERAVGLARLFQSVHEGVYLGTLGANSTSTLAANPYLKQMFGYAPDAADSIVQPFDPSRFVDPQARQSFVELLDRDGGVTEHLLRVRRVDGTPIWIEVSAVASHRPYQPNAAHAPQQQLAVLHIEALIRDVSDRKKREDQTRDGRYQMLQAEKMAALGQTISGVAHELNNPLATILSWAERLAERSVDDKTRQGLEVILAESERAARIVRNLLTFARKRQTTRAMVDLNQVVRETLALRAYEQKASNIEVVEALATGLPEVFADGHQIKQVLLNLLINAEQACIGANGRGTIVVRTSHDADRGSAVLEVNDDGPGIPEERQGKIFDPFFTTKEVGQGTGLGLTVAYAIVQEHGGRIWVQSNPARGAAAEGRGAQVGASFFIELPVTGQHLNAPPARAAQQPISLDAFKGLRVLVVEDEPALAVAVSEALVDAGFTVDRAGDGEEGLTRLTEARYDLIVCDLKMPRIDGMQFYRAMAAATPPLARRVIFVTGDVAGTDAERFLDETGCRWLSKPFRLGDLLRAARDTLS